MSIGRCLGLVSRSEDMLRRYDGFGRWTEDPSLLLQAVKGRVDIINVCWALFDNSISFL